MLKTQTLSNELKTKILNGINEVFELFKSARGRDYTYTISFQHQENNQEIKVITKGSTWVPTVESFFEMDGVFYLVSKREITHARLEVYSQVEWQGAYEYDFYAYSKHRVYEEDW